MVSGIHHLLSNILHYPGHIRRPLHYKTATAVRAAITRVGRLEALRLIQAISPIKEEWKDPLRVVDEGRSVTDILR